MALELAHEAGMLLMSQLQGPLNIEEKGRRADLVTDADRASERLIVERLRKDFPASTILGEETGMHAGTSNERWIIDPLDGTTNFAHGYPPFCVSIAFERAGVLCAAVVYAPFFNECFAAEKGSGARLNDAVIAVSKIDRISNALVCTGFHPADYARNGVHFESMSQRAQGVRRDGSAALDLAYVAGGRFDGFWEFDLSVWDVAAGALLITEAGGRVSSIDGSPLDLTAGSILASNGLIHVQMRELLAA
ncbi:MAG: inositol monophosphatase [Candidatus Eremiobacteraeota bacterium]|nr:inositol monophosphatase [Candidatus Eremiobacteraeota bacterium]